MAKDKAKGKAEEQNKEQNKEQDQEQQLNILKLYVQNASIEVPNVKTIFAGNWAPDLNISVSTKADNLEEDNTYNIALQSQGPVFNPSASDYQDFELPLDNLNDLVIKICQYAGVEIRETMVVQYAQAEEQQNNLQQ